MSKKKSPEEYRKTAGFRFFRWLSGSKDPFIGTVELHPQEEYKEDVKAYEERILEHERLHEKIYDVQTNKELVLFSKLYPISAILLCLIIIASLMFAVSYLPPVGSDTNPSNNEVVKRYIESGMEETGVVNTVTGMILKYRGFDTFGETCVLFIAASSVMILLMVSEEKLKESELQARHSLEPKDDIILQMVARILVPILFIFGFYVMVNGHLSPGGGFSGGAIIGSGLILYSSAFGTEKIRNFFNEKVYKSIKVTSLLLYGTVMIYYFYTGANGLPTIFSNGTPGNILSAGMIFYINIFVGSEVACTMYSFYALFKRGGL